METFLQEGTGRFVGCPLPWTGISREVSRRDESDIVLPHFTSQLEIKWAEKREVKNAILSATPIVMNSFLIQD